MAIVWNTLHVKGTVTTDGGAVISLEEQKGADHFAVFSVDGVSVPLTEDDLKDLMALISRVPRLGVG